MGLDTWDYGRALILMFIAAYRGVLIARLITSWLPMLQVRLPDVLEPFMRFLYDITEPFLRLFRRLIPTIGGFDLSPLLGFLVLHIVLQVANRALPL